jgi:RNA polymerase sigma factor (sigma-70 family)
VAYPSSCQVAEAPVPALIPSRERTAWISRHILPHEPALRAWLRRRLNRELEIDDVVQETYAVLADLAAVDHIREPRAYAFQTALSVLLQQAQGANLPRMDMAGDTGEPPLEGHAAAHQGLPRMRDLVLAMSPRQREVFALRKVQGLSQREIAQRMGIAEATVEEHLGQALRVLMTALNATSSLA